MITTTTAGLAAPSPEPSKGLPAGKNTESSTPGNPADVASKVSGIVNPADYGFSPGAPAAVNAEALQRALDGGKRIVQITRPGVYGLDRTMWLDDDTRLVCAPGVTLQKQAAYSYVFANRGLATGTWNENITLEGVKIDCNELSATHGADNPMLGNRGQLSFFCIRNLTIRNFKICNFTGVQFGIQIAAFENVVLDGFEIRGKKDGIHVNAGRKFVIRNGTLETGDDGIALNAEDWMGCTPVLGDIEDGLIENVTDDGNGKCDFSRILTGAWTDWHEGIRLQRGDTVRCGKRLYRVYMPLGKQEYISMEEPSHTQGVWKDKSGLCFIYVQDNGILSANIRNVTFRSIYLRSPRQQFLAQWETTSEYNRGIHPEVKKENYPVCEISLEDVYSESPYPLVQGNESIRLWLRNVYKTRGPLLCLSRVGCEVDKEGHIEMISGASRVGCDLDIWLHLSGVVLKNDNGKDADIYVNGAGCSLNLTIDGLMQERDLRLSVGEGVHARVNGMGSIDTLKNLTPKTGDSVKVNGVMQTFDGVQWRSAN